MGGRNYYQPKTYFRHLLMVTSPGFHRFFSDEQSLSSQMRLEKNKNEE